MGMGEEEGESKENRRTGVGREKMERDEEREGGEKKWAGRKRRREKRMRTGG